MPADGDVGTRATAVLRAAMPVSSGNLGLGMRSPVPAERDQDNRDGRPGRRPSKDSERSRRIANNDSSNTGESHIEARESGHDGCNVESVADSWTAQRIYNRQESESTRVGVKGTDVADSVLPHRHGRVQVVHHVPAEIRQFREWLR